MQADLNERVVIRTEAMMNISLRHALVFLGTAASVSLATPALAGCGDINMIKPTALQGTILNKVLDREPIVGMWSVQFVAGGALFDFGYAQWHSDGTEILNSGTRAPSTQNFCLGVWAQSGPNRYKLNHWALSYDPSGALAALVNIREEVTVTGDTYSGPFTVDAYNPKTKALLAHVAAGQVTGKRMNVNSGL